MSIRKIALLFALLTTTVLSSQTYNMSSTTVSTCSGNFYDSGGSASNYGNSQNLTMTFNSSSGMRLQFAFNSFAVETCCDRLYVYDGPTSAYPLVGIYTSNPGTIQSTGTSLTFVFTSDAGTTFSGWDATISCTTAPLTVYNMSAGTVTACSGAFYDNAGSSANYGSNLNITQTFCSGTSDHLQFSFLNAATNILVGDTLWAYDGATASAPLIGAYTVTSTIESFISSGTCVTFVFKSNASGVGSGWAGSFACTTTAPSAGTYNMSGGIRGTCGGTFYDSGGLNGTYSSNEGRVLAFQSTNGNRVSVTFTNFAVETCCDRLYVYDGPNTNYPLIGIYTGNPGTIVSTGTSLCFYFTSDNGTNYAGWEATVSCTTPALTPYNMTTGTITACSGAFYDSGGWQGAYGNSQNFTQTFCSGTSDHLQFNFWTAATNIAVGDTLWAYDGATASDPLIGAYTVTSTIESFISSGTCVTFVFKSNAATTGSGWAGWFNCTTSSPSAGTYNMSGGIRGTCGGTFYDSGGLNGTYSSNEGRVLAFQSTNGNRVSVTFTNFAVETCCDRLYVYDGPNTSCPLIGIYTGNPGTIVSTGTTICFYFTSDNGTNYAGWEATVSCTTPALTPYTMSPGTVTACSGVFYDTGGRQTGYGNSQTIVQTFCSGTSDHLQFTFWTAATDIIVGDTLFAYDGASASSPLIGAYTVSSTIESFISSGTCVTFVFKSNAATTGSGWAGWFNCTTTAPSAGTYNMSGGIRGTCGGTFYDSGGLNGTYSSNEGRVMAFQSYNGNRISIAFNNLSTESCCDRLYVYDGPTTSYPLLGTYTSNPGTITSSGTTLCFQFVSDGGTNYNGWEATISCTSPVLPVYSMSSGTVTVCEGVFYDNGGPSVNYPHNENRVMTFTSASGQYLKFDFNPNHFNLVTGDSLFIYDGTSVSAPLFAILTGATAPGALTSNTSSFTFRFKSNASGNNLGWQAWISCVATPDYNPVINMTSGVRYTCGGTFYDAGGASANYPNSDYRVMTFYSNSGCGISFTFNSFGTESCCDHLYVYDGPNTSAPLIGTYSGGGLPPVLQSTGAALTFAFSSDGSANGIGWSAVIACPTQPSASITPSGPTSLCTGGSVTLTAAPSTSYTWSNGATTQSILVNTSGAYWVTVTNAQGCTATSPIVNVSIGAPATPVITAGGPITFCQGGSVLLSTSASGNLLWSNNATSSSISVTQSGNYTVTTTDANNCSSTSAPFAVVVNPAPSPVISASGPTSICQGDSVTLSVPAGDSYLWSNGATTNAITVNQSGTYNVTVTNSYSCSGSAIPVTVNVSSPPTASISAGGPTTFCQGGSVLLSASGGSSYNWSDNSSGNSIVVTQSGTYYVVAYNGACSDTSGSVAVTVNALPNVTLALPLDTFCDNAAPVTLTGGTPAGGTYTGPGVTAGILNPAAAGSGTHTITYTYTDANSCSNAAQQIIFVDLCSGTGSSAVAGFNVMPNPAHESVTINLNVLEQTQEIRITDMTGRLIYSTPVNGKNTVVIPLDFLAPGVYLLHTDGGIRHTVKLIKE